MSTQEGRLEDRTALRIGVPTPIDEGLRLADLYATDLLGTEREEAFDALVRTAAFVADAPIALITLIDERQQWSKACFGPDDEPTDRRDAICAHTILDPATPLIVADLSLDPRFHDNPFVVGDPGIRFYCGVPLVSEGGRAYGALCVIDYVPRELEPRQVEVLQDLAHQASALIQTRARVRELELQATGEETAHIALLRSVGDIVEAADDLDDVLARALEAIVKNLGLSAGGLWWHDGVELATQPLWFDATGALTSVQRAREGLAYPADVMIHTRETATRHGIDVLPTIVTAALHEAGISASFMVPIVADGVTIGGYEMIPAAAGEPSPRRLLAAAQAAAEVGRWIERDRPARWLRDLADRTRDPEGEAVTRIPTERVRRRSAVKARIVAADERDELSVAYEPIVHLASGTTTAVEALARWDDAVLGRVAPNEFIPIAEESSAIARIGAFVRRRALADRTGLQARHAAADGFAVWVNVSARELDRGFADAVHAELEQAGVPAQCLALEVTEREALSAQSPGCAQLHELAASGVGIAIDDFGTGFTSLTQLRNLPLTHIKIDRSFVTDLAGEHGHRVRPIVGGIVSLGHSLGLQIVTEGIETLEQLEIARALGADLAQGHLLSR